MRRIATVAVCMGLLGALGPQIPAYAKTPRVNLTISNFRFCQAETCTPIDTAYLRTSDGPAGLENPAAAIDVKRGSIVYWIYQDEFCDTVGCPGHNVVFENGTASGVRKGFVAAGGTGKAIKVKITQKVGTTIQYFCSVNNHYETGMTGILNVVR
jgi:hypothetical protein